ncbi:hypothetical protein Dvina_43540 [Dactylosporangium vinaceum]|uniref:Uncharacterized protein n=1 Tax=Dactylosporangium vinaceum TaxID=53362 RepID=A0ABV5MH34_9ACTN|nr:hypothetical protein [Dactylosporangium vinaceum]UAB94890.1 hypothetical protein Dvina_43540 [Dactylosporangium vinaceum]
MYLITVIIERIGESALDPAAMAREVGAQAGPEDGFEHVSTHAGPDVLQVGIFCLARDRKTAETIALRLCRKALERQPQSAGWRLHDEPYSTKWSTLCRLHRDSGPLPSAPPWPSA